MTVGELENRMTRFEMIEWAVMYGIWAKQEAKADTAAESPAQSGDDQNWG